MNKRKKWTMVFAFLLAFLMIASVPAQIFALELAEDENILEEVETYDLVITEEIDLNQAEEESAMVVNLLAASFAGGDGSAENPYIIKTSEQLSNMALDLSASYRLGSDIDLENAIWTPIGDEPESELWELRDGPEWFEGSLCFTGTFDGAGYTISNLNLADSEMGGLFGYTYEAQIANVNLENVSNIEGSSGSLVYYALHTTIDNCVASNVQLQGSTVGGMIANTIGSTVQNSEVKVVCLDGYIAGGFAGYTANTIYEDCFVKVGSVKGTSNAGGFLAKSRPQAGIEVSYSLEYAKRCGTDVQVSGESLAGGFIGETNSTPISFMECYAEGDVRGQTAGGFVGKAYIMENQFTNCVAAGNIEMTRDADPRYNYVGTFAGYLFGAWEGRYTVGNCYTTGSVVNADTQFIGKNSGYTISSSYLLDATGQSEDPLAKSSEEMRQISTYDGWDFLNVWWMEDGASYPELRYRIPPVTDPIKARERLVYEWKIQESGEDIRISEIKDLVDFAGNRYTLIECEPVGYYIYHNESGKFPEYSPYAVSPYRGYYENIYYSGLKAYYRLTNLQFVNIVEKVVYPMSDLDILGESSQVIADALMEVADYDVLDFVENGVSEITARAMSSTNPFMDRIVEVTYVPDGETFFPALTKQFEMGFTTDTNPDTGKEYSICGYVAGNLILKYWNEQAEESFLDSELKHKGNLLTSELRRIAVNELNHSSKEGSSTAKTIAEVLLAFCEKYGVDANAKGYNYWLNSGLVKTEIEAGRPVILFGLMKIDWPLQGHAVVAYGYARKAWIDVRGVPQTGFTYVTHYGIENDDGDNFSQVFIEDIYHQIMTFELL